MQNGSSADLYGEITGAPSSVEERGTFSQQQNTDGSVSRKRHHGNFISINR